MNIDEINKKALEADNKGLCHFGVRVINSASSFDIKEGSPHPDSFVWVDGVQTDEKLDGVSSIGVEFCSIADEIEGLDSALSDLGQYKHSSDTMVVLVAGNESYEGNDMWERVIVNAEIVAIL